MGRRAEEWGGGQRGGGQRSGEEGREEWEEGRGSGEEDIEHTQLTSLGSHPLSRSSASARLNWPTEMYMKAAFCFTPVMYC